MYDNTIMGLRGSTVTLLDTRSGKIRHVLKGHEENVDEVHFAPRGDTVVTVSHWGEVILWDLHTDVPLVKLKRKDRSVTWFPVAYTPDGKTLAVGGLGTGALQDTPVTGGYGISLWDVHKGTLKKILAQPGDDLDHAAVGRLGFCPDGKTLVVVGGYGNARIRAWNIETGGLIHQVDARGEGIGPTPNGSGLSPDGTEVAVQGWPNSSLLLYNPRTGQSRAFVGHKHRVRNTFFSPDGKTLASTGSEDYISGDIGGEEIVELCIWDVRTGKLRWKLVRGQASSGILFSPDSRSLLVLGAPNKVYDVKTGATKQTLEERFSLRLFFKPDNKLDLMAAPLVPNKIGTGSGVPDPQSYSLIRKVCFLHEFLPLP